MRYCIGYGGILLRKWKYTRKTPVKQHANRAPMEEIVKFQRNIKARIKRCVKNEYPSLHRTRPYSSPTPSPEGCTRYPESGRCLT